MLALLTLFIASTLQQVGVMDDVDCNRITHFVESSMEELELVPGASVAVVQGDNIVYERGFGYRDIERAAPVTPETVFYTASLAKAITGMTASVLATRGKLDLDAPISRYFPELRMEAPLSADSISVRDLLGHSKSFRNTTINWVTSFVGSYSDAELVRVLSEYSTPAEEGFIYSNTGYAVAGYVIERAVSRSWRDVMDELIFQSVGMSGSTARLWEVPADRQAQPYLARADGFRRIPMLKSDETITGAGGIFSTAHDLARYVVANLNDGKIDGRQALPADAVRDAHVPGVRLQAEFFEFERYAYGLGLYLADYDGDTLVHHFGGFPGYRSHMSFMPEHDLGVVVLQNEGVDGNRYADIVATFIYDLLLGKPDVDGRARTRIGELQARVTDNRKQRMDGWEGRLEHLKDAPESPDFPSEVFVGTYESERLGQMRIHRKGDGLGVVYGALSGPAIPAGGSDFVVDWLPGMSPANVTFDIEDGRATALSWNFRKFERIEQ